MLHEFPVWALEWDEVDPAHHPFDAEQARTVVAGLPPARTVPSRPSGQAADRAVIRWSDEAGQAWADEMTRALAGHYDRWAMGWRWAHDEGDIGGGPVGAWCCPSDSITTPAETLVRVADALVEWRGWLEDLAERFDRYPIAVEASPEERQHAWERGAAHLVTTVADRTNAGDAWYGHCRQVLTWYLTRWHIAPAHAGPLVEDAIDGRFESWIQPSPLVIENIAERLANSLSEEPRDDT